MKATLKNILAVFVGMMLGSVVNMGIIMISGKIIPPPPGTDLTTMEGLKASMHLFTPINFLMPFLAHALGTLFGAYIAALMSVNHALRLALIIGLIFMIGGIMNVKMLPSPLWFSMTDIIGAYLPMGYLGYKLAGKE